METEAFTRYGPGIARKMLTRLAERLSFLARKGQLSTPELDLFQKQVWSDMTAGQVSPLADML
jgi:hypothetical protein